MPSKFLTDIIKRKAVTMGDFTLTSGKKSSYYIDIKKVYTAPEVLEKITDELAKLTEGEKIDKIAGPAVGAVPLAVGLSIKMKIPFLIFRRDTKSHGTMSRIEGELLSGDRVVVVEDVTTSGGSVLETVKAIREKNGVCNKVIAVVDRLEGAAELLKKNGVALVPLLTAEDLNLR